MTLAQFKELTKDMPDDAEMIWEATGDEPITDIVFDDIANEVRLS